MRGGVTAPAAAPAELAVVAFPRASEQEAPAVLSREQLPDLSSSRDFTQSLVFLICIFLELIMYKYGEKSLECRRKRVNTKTEKKLTSYWLGQREKPATHSGCVSLMAPAPPLTVVPDSQAAPLWFQLLPLQRCYYHPHLMCEHQGTEISNFPKITR